jgi:hypothetical protein
LDRTSEEKRLVEQATLEGVLSVPRALRVTLLDTEEDGTLFVFGYDGEREGQCTFQNAFEAANAFLDARSPRALLRIFRKYGPLTNSKFPTKQVRLGVVLHCQRLWRHFRDGSISFEQVSILDGGLKSETRGYEEWTTRLPQLQPIWGEPLVLEAQCKDLLHALNLTLFADKLSSIERLYCRLESCRAPFTRRKGEKRFFCVTEHGTKFHQAKYKRKTQLADKSST